MGETRRRESTFWDEYISLRKAETLGETETSKVPRGKRKEKIGFPLRLAGEAEKGERSPKTRRFVSKELHPFAMSGVEGPFSDVLHCASQQTTSETNGNGNSSQRG